MALEAVSFEFSLKPAANILGVSNRFQMFRVDADTNATQMVYDELRCDRSTK